MPDRLINILFLCIGNSCRSQMAEGWARTLGVGKVDVQSAGIEAHGKNPRAIAVMDEAGVDIFVFRATRDDIRERVQSLISELVEQTNRTGAEP